MFILKKKTQFIDSHTNSGMRREHRPTKFNFTFGLKMVFAAEFACFAAAYTVWYWMNTDRNFRHKIYKNYPSVLNTYYWTVEKAGRPEIRENDYYVWGLKKEKE